jgi:hypothetical protein
VERERLTIFDDWEDSLARADQCLDEVEVQPLALALCAEHSPGRVQSVANGLEELELKEALCWPHRVTGVDDDTVIGCCRALVDDEFGGVLEEELQAGVTVGCRNFFCKVFLQDSVRQCKAGKRRGMTLEISTTCLSISHMWMVSTHWCLTTSLRTPPSPPPTIRTFLGLRAAKRGM